MTEAADGLDDIRAEAQRVGGTCSVGAAFGVMAPDVRDRVERGMELAAAGTDRQVTFKAISRYLKRHDYHIADYTLRRHHNGDCTCE